MHACVEKAELFSSRLGTVDAVNLL